MGIVDQHIVDKLGNARKKIDYVDILTLLMCGGVRLDYYVLPSIKGRNFRTTERRKNASYYLRTIMDNRSWKETDVKLHRLYPNHGTCFVGYVDHLNFLPRFRPSLILPPLSLNDSGDLERITMSSRPRPPVEFHYGKHIIRVESQNSSNGHKGQAVTFNRYQRMVESFEESRSRDKIKKLATTQRLFRVA